MTSIIDIPATDASTMAVRSWTSYPKRSRPQCSHCGLLGHIKDKCYNLNCYSPGYQFRNKNNDKHAVANMATNAASTDTGAFDGRNKSNLRT